MIAPTVGVVLVSHGEAARALLDAAHEMTGALPQVVAVTAAFGEPTEDLRRRVESAVDEVDQGGGVLMIVDLCGSTPANVCSAVSRARANIAEATPTEVLFGLSLPMLAKIASAKRHLGPTALGAEVRDSARRNITLGSDRGRR